VRIAMVAGEASGDLLAAHLLAALKARWPGLQAFGIGGPAMASQGFTAWWPSERLAVRGYVEVLRHYPALARMRRELGDRLIADPPRLFIGVDAPDFNFGLEERLKNAGIRTAHFISPSIWAWRAGRVDQVRRSTDLVLCVFPFEPQLLAEHGTAATYVGHPLAQVIPLVPDQAAARRKLGLSAQDLVLAVLPGSRAKEIEHLALRFFQAAVMLEQSRGAIKIVVPALPSLKAPILAAARQAGLTPGDGRLVVLDGESHTALAACDLALVASGTATLEAALFKKPMVVAYHMHPVSWWLHRRQQLQPWVGLPNILCREFVVPERIQDAATPRALADALQGWLDAPGEVQRLAERFTALHLELRRDSARLAADALAPLIG